MRIAITTILFAAGIFALATLWVQSPALLPHQVEDLAIWLTDFCASRSDSELARLELLCWLAMTFLMFAALVLAARLIREKGTG